MERFFFHFFTIIYFFNFINHFSQQKQNKDGRVVRNILASLFLSTHLLLPSTQWATTQPPPTGLVEICRGVVGGEGLLSLVKNVAPNLVFFHFNFFHIP